MSDETTAEDIQREEAALRASLQRRRAEREALKAETIALEILLQKQTKFVQRMERSIETSTS